MLLKRKVVVFIPSIYRGVYVRLSYRLQLVIRRFTIVGPELNCIHFKQLLQSDFVLTLH